ncbi:hypothetical protein EQG41_06735 [Billgrantia azerbaijanica]|nr:hypothetical protein EQG41_06735 [Halomonas azerbaijanica]
MATSSFMSIQQWNAKLVQAVFHDNVNEAPEIRRIDASNSFLAHAGGFDTGEEARDSFIRAMPHDGKKVRQLFDQTALSGWSVHGRELPFYVQLHLTILASSADDNLHEQGDFRLRLAQMLGLPVSHYISQGCLPELWEMACRWSELRADRHQDTRRLILPDRGAERIIGYSKRLAFPGFRDQNHLAELFTEKGIDASSPARTLLDAIRERIGRFSTRFHDEFVLFARAWERGDQDSAIDTLFWAAVRDTTWSRDRHNNRAGGSGFRLEIDPTDPGDPGLWLYGSPHVQVPPGWSKEPDDQLNSGLVRWRHRTDADAPRFLQRLREQWLSHPRLEVPGPRLGSALVNGCIGFVQDEEGRWFDTPAFPQAGTLWLLLRRNHELLLHAISKDPEASSLYIERLIGSTEWSLIGPIEASEGWREWFRRHVVGLDFFSPPPERRRVVVVDAIRRHDGAYLWLPPIEPAFRCKDAQSGTAIIHSDGGERWFDLQLKDGKLLMPESLRQSRATERTLQVIATDESGNEIESGSFSFRDSSCAYGFKTLRSPSKFLESGSHGRLQSYSPNWDVCQVSTSNEKAGTASPALSRVTRMDASMPEPICLDPMELDERWRRTTEILSAVFSQRQAWSLSECCDHLRRIWGSPRKGWEKLDDLIENGVLHILHSRHWSNRLVVAGHPAAVFHETSDHVELRVVGLLSHAMRALADGVLGSRCKVVASPDRKTAGAYVWHLGDIKPLEALQSETDWPLIPLSQLSEVRLPCFPHILRNSLRDDLVGYEEEKKITLSPHGHKSPLARYAPELLPRLERWSSQGLQDLYVLHRKDGSLWNTDCRIWALLTLWYESNSTFGVACENGSIRLADRALKLPRAVSLRTVAAGGGVCVRASGGSLIYPAGDSWSPVMACPDWIGDYGHSYYKCNSQKTALDRYTRLLERERRARRPS